MVAPAHGLRRLLVPVLLAALGLSGSPGRTATQPDPCEGNSPVVTLSDRYLGQTLCPSASGGSGPYTWLWSTGETTVCVTATEVGTYTVTATDQEGCTGTASAQVTCSPITVTLEDHCLGDWSCPGVSGGITPHTYLWSTGATTNCIRPTTPGIYTLTVTNAVGCSATSSSTVGECCTITVTMGDICLGRVSCPTVSGGAGPYDFLWSTGETTSCITPAATGPYSVTVTDQVGCSATGSLNVIAPPVLVLSDACPGDSLCTQVTGGTPPYTYIWDSGETGPCSICPGTRAVTVTDSKGCWDAGSATLCKSVLRVPQEFPTIQAALDCAEHADTVLVAPGTYQGPGNVDLNPLGSEVLILGQGGAAATIIDCQGSGSGFVFDQGETTSTVVKGLTVMNAGGPGILVQGASPAIVECRILQGSATGILCDAGSPRITDCEVSGNSSSGNNHAGGVTVLGGAPALAGCTISNNASTHGPGGIALKSTATVEDCLVTGNQGVFGGGIDIRALATVTGCTVAGNTATSDGGGLYVLGVGADVQYCSIYGNQALRDGGGVYQSSYNSLINCTVTGNHADRWGGGLFTSGGYMTRLVLWGNCADGEGDQARTSNFGISFTCCLVDSSGIVETGFVSYYDPDCLFEDPQLCNTLACTSAPTTMGTYAPLSGSPCLPENNACGALIGAGGDCSSVIGIEDPKPPAPGGPLLPPSPNPFRGQTLIRFRLEEPSPVRIRVFDIHGRLVRDLLDDPLRPAGTYDIPWSGATDRGDRAPRGIYFLRLVTTTESASRRVVLLR